MTHVPFGIELHMTENFYPNKSTSLNLPLSRNQNLNPLNRSNQSLNIIFSFQSINIYVQIS